MPLERQPYFPGLLRLGTRFDWWRQTRRWHDGIRGRAFGAIDNETCVGLNVAAGMNRLCRLHQACYLCFRRSTLS